MIVTDRATSPSRQFKKEEEKMENRSIKFRYIRASKNSTQLIGCIAVNSTTGEMGWSYCSGKLGDRFSKRQARGIAMDRLGKTVTTKIVPHKVLKEIESIKEWLAKKNLVNG